MSPAAALIVSWAAMAAAAWAAVEADRTGSPLMMAIAAMCGVIFVLGQSLALSLAVGREHDRVLSAMRAMSGPANDDGAR